MNLGFEAPFAQQSSVRLEYSFLEFGFRVFERRNWEKDGEGGLRKRECATYALTGEAEVLRTAERDGSSQGLKGQNFESAQIGSGKLKGKPRRDRGEEKKRETEEWP